MAMVSVEAPGGCEPWDVDTACDLSEFGHCTPAVAAMALSVAVANLYWLTGRQFGVCSTTYRPCDRNEVNSATTYRFGGAGRGYMSASAWYGNLDLASLRSTGFACSSCSTPSGSVIRLPVHPVTAVTDVTIAGESIPLSEFVIYNGREITWQSPTSRRFPTNQNLLSPPTEPDAWSITVTHGRAVPALAASIAGHYACQLAKLLNDDKSCTLPRSATTVSRQGVTYQLADDSHLERGLVGEPLVDRFILSVNPNRLTGPSSFHSPQARRPAVQSWQGV